MVVVVLELELGQSCIGPWRPVDRCVVTIDEIFFVEVKKDVQLAAHVVDVLGAIELLPVCQEVHLFERVHLFDNVLVGVLVRLSPQLHLFVLTRRLATALLHGFEDIVLNGQTVTIPAWHIMNPVTRHEFVSEVDVFEHLVDHMAHVDVAIGVGRTVVENEQRLGIAYLSSLLLPFVQAVKRGYLDSETRSSKHLSMPTHFTKHTHTHLAADAPTYFADLCFYFANVLHGQLEASRVGQVERLLVDIIVPFGLDRIGALETLVKGGDS